MKEIVINNDYGGFGLSDEALLELYAKGSKAVTATEPKEYFGGGYNWEEEFAKAMERAKQSEGVFTFCLAPDGYILTCSREDKNRDCPILVYVVKKMGDKANSFCATLKVVEIPDDVQWCIEEYDGMEWIAEKHRTWR